MRARTRRAIVSILLAAACTDAPPPPGPSAVELAAALLGPEPRGPQLLVELGVPGKSAFEVEVQVLNPLEEALAPYVETMESVALRGHARVYLTLAAGADPVSSMATLRSAIPMRALPQDVTPPTLTRADRDGGLMFVMVGAATPGEPSTPAHADAFDRAAAIVGKQPGIWSVLRCGEPRPMLVVEIDPSKMAALGVSIEQVMERLERIESAATERPSLDRLLGALSSYLVGTTLKLADLATIATEPREGACTVMGSDGLPRPTLRVWGTAEAIERASTALAAEVDAGTRLQTWVAGRSETPIAFVSPSTPLADHRADLRLWMALDGAKPSWIVHDGFEPAWLLASPDTTLRSFSLAQLHRLHVWWPGAPIPVTVRICGPELDTLARTAESFAAAMSDGDLLDDLAVWAPPGAPRRVFEIDGAAAVRHGIPPSSISRITPLVAGESIDVGAGLVELRLAEPRGSLLVRAKADALVPITALGAVHVVAEPGFVHHVDRQRCVDVDLQPKRDADRERIEDLVRKELVLPVGVFVTIVPVP